VHWLAYLAWPVAFVHSLTAGGDLGLWWVALIEWGCATAVVTAILARILEGIRHPRLAGQPSASFDRLTPRKGALR
jgi:hypothetical protein